jgi:transposase-like protein
MSGNRSSRARPREMDFPRLVERYGTEDKARVYLEELRWPEGIVCPKCQHKGTSWIATRRVRECNSCGHQFTVRVGTVLQDSKLPLWKWLVATFLMVESKKGMSANQVRRMTGTTYKTAWFLTHRIREAMSQVAATTPLRGAVEVDETYIGGKPRYRRLGKRGWDHQRNPKTMVLGAVERSGAIRLRVEHRGANMGTLGQFIRQNVAHDSPAIYTDEAPAYKGIGLADKNTKHETVNHRAEEWVRGDVHTNSVESVWSLFKRSIVGSYHHLSAKHMDKYLDEFEWRFNNRHNDFLFRDTMRALMRSDTMTYKALTNPVSQLSPGDLSPQAVPPSPA